MYLKEFDKKPLETLSLTDERTDGLKDSATDICHPTTDIKITCYPNLKQVVDVVSAALQSLNYVVIDFDT
ncbi:hypothetical protein DPMN_131453 [Dreissena polymorpha]|uniref:Uncharacterized protein n=1 Tax=Dreissena polymorpha TaxID=45954 RepID=A0A9D4HCZ3_DREPO|nr:hypothetical protein DPMN_131453 [Dreissena polymorpha]